MSNIQFKFIMRVLLLIADYALLGVKNVKDLQIVKQDYFGYITNQKN